MDSYQVNWSEESSPPNICESQLTYKRSNNKSYYAKVNCVVCGASSKNQNLGAQVRDLEILYYNVVKISLI